ncbi:MAG: hypothetical protein ACQCXQ_06140 [Verrucomicrobiales bacterium]
MSEGNPYSPPAVAESEVPVHCYWQVDGTDLLARNATTLPKVDLESGLATMDGSAVFRRRDDVQPGIVLMGLALFGVILVLRSQLDVSMPVIMMGIFAVTFVFGRVSVFRRGGGGPEGVWLFVDERRAKRVRWRKRIRIAALLLVGLGIVAGFYLPAVFGWMDTGYFMIWLLGGVPLGVVLIVAIGVWSALDRGKVRLKSGPSGWVRITGVHSAAIDRLRELQAGVDGEGAGKAGDDGGRERGIRTMYYHRFPLRLLLGPNWKNPWIVFNLVLMKWLRSRLLEQETYHFSEASERQVDELCATMRNRAEEWLAAHPDWVCVHANQLGSPAGHFFTESMVMASPGLEHCMVTTCSWTVQKPDRVIAEACFHSWVDGLGLVSTMDHPTLDLPVKDEIRRRVRGTPEQVFAAHLGFCAGGGLRPPEDIGTLRERLLEKREEMDRLLVELGYQSETRRVPDPGVRP